MAIAVAVLMCFTLFVQTSAEVNQVEQKDIPHAPFSELDEKQFADHTHRIFSVEELGAYDGTNPELPIYLAVKGVVFDVTTAKEFYGSGKTYSALAGIDASRAIAKWSMSTENLNGNLGDLNKEELDRLEESFHDVYMKKYPVIGYLKGYEPRSEDNLSWKHEDL